MLPTKVQAASSLVAERRHQTFSWLMPLEPQQRTGVYLLGNTGLLRSTLGTPLDDYGRLVYWDKHNSGFFLLPWYLVSTDTMEWMRATPLVNISAVAFLQEGLPLYNLGWNPCSETSTLSWLLRSRVRSLQPRTSNASLDCEAILKAWLWSLTGLGTRCSGSSVLVKSAG